MNRRTFAIGDIHGDLAALDRLLTRLPQLSADDTVVFIGDYVDRGPDSRGVVERIRALIASSPAHVVALRGNHEQLWIACHETPDLGFLLPVGNGCANTFRSFTGGRPLGPDEALEMDELQRLFRVGEWFPSDVVAWMRELPLWYEDEHAIYVHAGLEHHLDHWNHPSESTPKALLWMREPDFWKTYQGKPLVFGHTPVENLPLDHLGTLRRLFDDPKDVWLRGDLAGIDTGCGKGGFLSAIGLPAMRVYESR